MSKRLPNPNSSASIQRPMEQHAVLVPIESAVLASLGGEVELCTKLLRMKREAHPNWLGWLGYDAVSGHLVREWASGFTLRDVLRCRRELPLREVVELCARLPAALQAMEDAGWPILQPLIGNVFIAFGSTGDSRAWLDEVVVDWPAFTVKLDPLQISVGLVADQRGGPEATWQMPKEVASCRALAALVYELLGGRASGCVQSKWVPVDSLNESANTVLRAAFLGAERASPIAFWQAFVREAEKITGFNPRIVSEEPSPARVVAKALGTAKRGTMLRLRPKDRKLQPLYVSARPTLRIGRGTGLADLETRFLPTTPANVRLTDRLGRIHAIGRRVNGWPCFWDGDGRRASVNGTWLDGERLDDQAGTRCARESSLRLGRQYRLSVTCLDEGPVELQGGREKPEKGRAYRGCTAIVGARGQASTRSLAWLGDSVGLQVEQAGLTWSLVGAAQSAAVVLHAEGGFWLANLASQHALSIDGAAVPAGCAVALRDGQDIEVGTVCYAVRVEV